MNKQGKKLCALILALTMSLQWLPALASDPTVTVGGTGVTVDAGNQTKVYVNVSEMSHAQDVSVTLSENYVLLEDSVTHEQKPDYAESIIVNTGDVTNNGEDYQEGVTANAAVGNSPVDVDITVNVGSVSVAAQGADDASSSANTKAVVANTSDNATVTVNVKGDVTAEASSEHGSAEAIGVHTNYSNNGEGGNVTVTATGSVEAEAIASAENMTARAEGIGAISSDGKNVNINTGDVSASANGGNGYNAAIGVSASSSQSTVTVETGSVTAESNGQTDGIQSNAGSIIENWDNEGNSTGETVTPGQNTVTANGDVSASGSGNENFYVSTGVSTFTVGGQESQNTVSVTGSVSAEHTGIGDAAGVRTNGAAGTTTTVTVGEDVSATAKNGATGVSMTGPGNATVTAEGSVTATSENGSATGIDASADDGGKAMATVGDVKATSGSTGAYGVQAKANEGTVTVETGSVTAEGAYGVSGINSQAGSTKQVKDENGEWKDKTVEGTSTVTAAGDVKATATDGMDYWVNTNGVNTSTQAGSENTVTVTGGVSADNKGNGDAIGVNASGAEDSTTTVAVGKDVSASAKNGATGVNAEGSGDVSVTVQGGVSASSENGNATGIFNNMTESKSTIEAGNVTAYTLGANDATGVTQRMSGESVSSVTVKDVTVTESGASNNGGATGIEIWEGAGGSLTIANGKVNVVSANGHAQGIGGNISSSEMVLNSGDITVEGNTNASGIGISTSKTDSPEVTDGGKATATVNGNVTAVANGTATAVSGNAGNGSVTIVNVTGDLAATTENGNARGISVSTNQGGGAEATVTVEGDVTVTAKDGFTYGINASAQVSTTANVTVEGDVTAESEKTSRGIQASATGGSVNIETGSVTVTGSAIATGIQTTSSNNDLTDSEGNIISSVVGSVDITANGNVTATSAEGEATGINVVAYKDSETDVVVVGDVTAEGKEKGVGIFVRNDNADVDIVVDGTVSGSTNAIEVLTSQAVNGNVQASMDVADTTLTVWAAEENKDGHVAVAVDRNIVPGNEERPAPIITDTVNEEATKALEASINYIVKISNDFIQKMTAVGEKGSTAKVGETTYATANEGEDVNVGVTLDSEKEILEGVYYNAEDETTLTKTEDLEKNEQGGFLMKMLRGGAMLLGLKVHTHSYTDYKYNNDATCTADGTETAYCTCGKAGETRTKAGTKLGHSFGAYVSDGNATCTADGTKTATCSRCGATDTVADPGSVLGHSFTNYVSDGNATCAADGTKTAKCDRCTETDTIADVDSHLNVAHTPGEQTLVNIGGSLYQVVYCAVCGSELSRDPYTTTDTDPDPEPDNNNNNAPDDANITPEGVNETPNVEDNTSTVPEPEMTVATETSIAADGSSVTKELETSNETKQNDDGTVTVTDTVKETLTTENKDGSVVEVKTESTKEETTGSQKNEDGSVTDTTTVNITETVTETATDADGNKVVMETKTETESNTAVTTTENDDGSVTETTEKTETVKVTEKVTDAEGNITETLTETTTETVTNMTRNEDGTETGSSTTTATVKDERGNVLSTSVTEAEIKASTDENGMKTTETKATVTTTDADGNETVQKTVTTENKAPDGSTGTIMKDEEVKILSQDTTISQEAFDKAMEERRPIQAPLTVEPVDLGSCGELPPIKVNLPPSFYDKDGDGKVNPGERPKLEIQVSVGGAGVIVAEVGPDGTLIIRKDCYEGSVIVPLIGSSSIVVFDNAKTFADVSESDWYYEYVTFVTAREIINGVDEDNYAPDEAMSRAMLAQMLYGFDQSAKAGNGAQFDDVSEDDLFSGAVGWACENGIMEGNEGSFKPMDEVACQDMITALYRWAEAAGYDVSARARIDNFSDADSVADYAKDALRWAAGWGLIGGEDEGDLTLTGSVTRAQAASIMTHFVRNAR